ncbi:hypothetical protein JXA02_00960 [candidate division KSB1 bacterium]|nr:hypothetical protein [candidate division KSB1 bacterium]RQW11355.1 MAG: hypothetical protein EH222_01015 [candidate division KSB1 bacterium]
MKKSLFINLILFACTACGQVNIADRSIDYSFIIQDTPSQLFTMRQVNQSYLSAYRLGARGLYDLLPNNRTADLLQVGLQALFLMPLTHEEGHRSILTVNNIGSISQPYFNKHGAAYVKGVTDQTLKNLRDADLPTYIRLHAAGLESDYMLTQRIEAIGSFDQDLFRHYKWEYWMRKLSILQYYATGLFKYGSDLTEETDELERDIVGHDIYGAARHLHRPTMEFHRYTAYDDLTAAERKYVNRLGYRSLLNLLNPLIIGVHRFRLTSTTYLNAGLGHAMAPFGDFIDENVWLTLKSLNISFYARQFQNRENWLPGFGAQLHDVRLLRQLSMSLAAHFWRQPENFDFNTAAAFTGGAIDIDVRYFFFIHKNAWLDAFSIDLGLIYKAAGFLPEEVYLDEHFGVRFGTTMRL